MKAKEYSKKISIGVLYIICYAYGIGAMGSVTYFNWRYAKDNGFVKWLFLGEIIATAKGIVWPYYVFSTPVNRYDSPDDNHFRNSKKAFDEALMIIDKVGDVSKLPSDLKAEFADLLRLAIAEANQVQPLYLQKAHFDYPSMYEKKYKYGMSLILQGIETDNTALILEGAYKCNEFADWIHTNKTAFSP
jgi:hypothetical protein